MNRVLSRLSKYDSTWPSSQRHVDNPARDLYSRCTAHPGKGPVSLPGCVIQHTTWAICALIQRIGLSNHIKDNTFPRNLLLSVSPHFSPMAMGLAPGAPKLHLWRTEPPPTESTDDVHRHRICKSIQLVFTLRKEIKGLTCAAGPDY